MMKTIKYFLALLVLMASQPLYAQNRFVVYKASRGVVLQSSDQSINKDLKRGTPIFDDDKFLLNNEHFYIKIKEINSGEIFSFSGRDTLTAKEIANQQKYYLFDKFRKFLISQTSEFGFNVSPVTTKQCVTSKGRNMSESIDSLSNIIALNISTDIQTGHKYHGVVIQKEFIDDEVFNYVVVNNDTSTYALVVYSVSKERLNKHNNVITYESGSFRPSKIEFNILPGKYALKLDYLCLSTKDDADERTFYAILFNLSDLYVKTEQPSIYDYECLIDWEIIERALTFEGNDERVIFIRK